MTTLVVTLPIGLARRLERAAALLGSSREKTAMIAIRLFGRSIVPDAARATRRPRAARAARLVALVAGALLVGAVGQVDAQTPVKNPVAIEFTSVDHALLSRYEVDILTEAGAVVQTITVSVGDTVVTGEIVRVALHVQPIAFGRYVIRVRGAAGEVRSVDSEPTEVWERAPGRPSRPVVR